MPQPSLLPRTSARLLALLPAVLTVVLAVMLLVPAGAGAAREIPVGMSNTADQNLRNSQWLYAIRFVLDRDTTMYRFFSQMKAKGAPWDEHGVTCSQAGPGCYAAGDGGIINVRLVRTKADGTPDLSKVLAQETINPRTRYFDTKSAYGVSGITLFWYFNMGGVRLKGNTPYAMVYRNLHGDPAHNFSSTNSISVKESDAGPNGRNNLDPNAPGAIAGLDPREATAWSTNAGARWTWGRQVGHYFGSTTSDEGVRLPHYAWQSSPTAKPQSNQPYTAYLTTCAACILTASAVPRRTTLTEAGGYAPVGKSVGVVTVRNLRTGQTGHTASLGSGIRRGALDPPVTVDVGDSYQITHTGTVFKMEADGYQVAILGLGSGAFPFNTAGSGADRAQLFALPDPYLVATATSPRGRKPRIRGLRGGPAVSVRTRADFAARGGRDVRSRRPLRRLVAGRLRVRGVVKGAHRPGGRRVTIRARRRGDWRTVGHTRVRSTGRFGFHRTLRVRRPLAGMKVRAVVSGVGRSRPTPLRHRP